MHFWVYRTEILFLENVFAAGCMSVVSSSFQTNKLFSKMFPTNMYFGAMRLVYRVWPNGLFQGGSTRAAVGVGGWMGSWCGRSLTSFLVAIWVWTREQRGLAVWEYFVNKICDRYTKRVSAKVFIISRSNDVPDVNTIWMWVERLDETGSTLKQ